MFLSCTEVRVRVGGVGTQPFTVGVGPRPRCAMSPLVLVVHMISIDSHRRVEEGVTVASCRSNQQPFAFGDNLALLAFSQQDLQHALDRFSAACDQAGMAMSTKIPRKKTSMSLQKFRYAASECQYTITCGGLQVPSDCTHERRKSEQGD